MSGAAIGVVWALVVGCGSITISPDGGGGHGGGNGGAGGKGGSGGGAAGGAGGTIKDAAADTAGCLCPAILSPVCGVDGKTYGNACEATCAGVAVASTDACKDGGAGDARGVCNTDSDCVFRADDSCCGSCLALGDPSIPRGPLCAGIACIAPPGGCSCVNHVCQRGILQSGASCNMQHDTCGSGLACCIPCGAAPIDGAACSPPKCVQANVVQGKATCPLFP